MASLNRKVTSRPQTIDTIRTDILRVVTDNALQDGAIELALSELTLVKQEHDSMSVTKRKLETELSAVKNQLQTDQKQVKTIEQELLDVTRQRNATLVTLQDTHTKLDAMKSKKAKEIEEYESIKAETIHMTNDVTNHDAIMESAKKSIAPIKAEYDRLLSKKKEVYSEITAAKELLDKETRQVNLLDLTLASISKQHSDLNSEHSRIADTIDADSKKIVDIKAKIELLKEESATQNGLLNTEMDTLKQLKVESDAILLQKKTIYAEILRIKGELTQESNRLALAETTLSDTRNKYSLVQKAHKDTVTQHDSLNKAIAANKQSTENIVIQIQELTEKASTLDKENKATLLSFNPIKKQHADLIATKSKLSTELTMLKDLLQKEQNSITTINSTIKDTTAKYNAANKELQKNTQKNHDILREITNIARDIDTSNEIMKKSKTEYLEVIKTQKSKQEEVQFITQKLAKEKQINTERTHEVDTLNGQLASEKKINSELVKTLFTLNRERDTLSQTIDKMTRDIATTQTAIQDNNTRRDSQNAILVKDTATLNLLLAENHKHAQSIKKIKENILKGQQQKTEHESELITRTQQLQALTQQLSTLSQTIDKTTKDLQLKKKALEEQNKISDKQTRELEITTSTLTNLQKEIATSTSTKNNINEQITAARDTINKIQHVIKTTQLTLKDTKQQIYLLQEDKNIAVKQSEINISTLLKDKLLLDEITGAIPLQRSKIVSQRKLIEDMRMSLAPIQGELEAITHTKDDLTRQLTTTRDLIVKETAASKRIEQELATTKLQLKTLQHQIATTEASIPSLKATFEKDTETYDQLKPKFAILSSNASQKRKEIDDLNNTLKPITEEYKSLVATVSSLTTQLTSTKMLIVKEQQNSKALEAKLLESKTQYGTLQKENGDANRQITAQTRTIHELKVNTDDIILSIALKKKEIKTYTQTIEEARSYLKTVQSEFDSVTHDKKQITEKLISTKNKIIAEQQHIKESEQIFAEISKQLDAAKKFLAR